MSRNIKNQKTAKNDAKKAMVLGPEKPSRLPLFLTIAVLFIVAGGWVVFSAMNTSIEQNAVQSAQAAAPQGGIVAYAANDFSDGKARHFQYKDGNITIKYFILKSSDGIIRAAFDACDVCWPAGKGYYQDGDFMVCRNCGRRFASVQVNEVSGGCNPAPLVRQIQGDKVVIQVKDILTGRSYFNLA